MGGMRPGRLTAAWSADALRPPSIVDHILKPVIVRRWMAVEVGVLFFRSETPPEGKPNLEQPLFGEALPPSSPERRIAWILDPGRFRI
jgi:hypothetical protein